jgi:hypothetical protein
MKSSTLQPSASTKLQLKTLAYCELPTEQISSLSLACLRLRLLHARDTQEKSEAAGDESKHSCLNLKSVQAKEGMGDK